MESRSVKLRFSTMFFNQINFGFYFKFSEIVQSIKHEVLMIELTTFLQIQKMKLKNVKFSG